MFFFLSLNNNIWADKYVKNSMANSNFIQGIVQSKLDIASVLYKIMVEIMTFPESYLFGLRGIIKG